MRDDSPIGETEHRITEKAGQRLPVDLPAVIALHHIGHAAGNLHIVVHTGLPHAVRAMHFCDRNG